jgi:hypothetical protein
MICVYNIFWQLNNEKLFVFNCFGSSTQTLKLCSKDLWLVRQEGEQRRGALIRKKGPEQEYLMFLYY